MAPFEFSTILIGRPSAVFARIPAGIRRKSDLLNELGTVLCFPEYYGSNWDALEECMGDLSWLPPGVIALAHHDVPLGGQSKSQAVYLSILSGAVEKHRARRNENARELAISFPANVRVDVEELLRRDGK